MCKEYIGDDLSYMKQLIAKILISGIALKFTSGIIEGMYVDGWGAVFIAAIILGIVNAVIRPLLLILTLPLNVFTLGLFTFVINGLLLKTVATVVAGFDIVGVWPAIIGAIILSVVSTVLNWLISE
jgi:putative membrane protein